MSCPYKREIAMVRCVTRPPILAGSHDRPVNDTVVLHTVTMPAAPALTLRPWRMEDVPALLEVCQDLAMRRWTISLMSNDAEAMRWVQAQQRGWVTGNLFGFAVLEKRAPIDKVLPAAPPAFPLDGHLHTAPRCMKRRPAGACPPSYLRHRPASREQLSCPRSDMSQGECWWSPWSLNP
ncbi:hypothetical protein Vqi01_29600 [Micromonospora qiuiae]|uniref:N-acetyltransferase domain-containing protein n=1 Tax=Micromonospora qiuiae TaxID=502268 RepID=A0ABQ4JCG1_9ACTN|nr:hypothetical protein Vqi01_29600 [Micromonospora qiuiae]